MHYQYLLVSPTGKTFLGKTLGDAMGKTKIIQIDGGNRRIVYDGRFDSVAFSKDMPMSMFYDSAVNRAVQLLRKDGWMIAGLHEIL
jgi:hypothetical protein